MDTANFREQTEEKALHRRWRGTARGQAGNQSLVLQQPRESGFSKASPAEYCGEMDEHEDR